MTLILFTTHAPNALANELAQKGHEVYEALAISEVLGLAEVQPDAQIIITPEIGQDRARVIQEHYPTVQLSQNVAVERIIWELCSRTSTSELQ